jgi:16S rRNA (cytosine1402-N4)-methyltransferase
MEDVHVPVLLEECLRLLAPEGGEGLLLDCTLGEGGHSKAFMERFEGLRVIGLDADPDAQLRAKERLAGFGSRIEFVNEYFDEYLGKGRAEEERPDIVLMDLGISMFHYELSGRGFSFRRDEPLDMRLDARAGRSAADLVAECREEELADIIFRYGEERYSRRIARAIVRSRSAGRIGTAKALAEVIWGAVPPEARRGRLHPATRSFQALRIAVNDELGRLERALSGAAKAVKVGGKVGVITFHSLEDGLVKRSFRELARACTCPPEVAICACGGKPAFELLTKKPVEPSEAEVEANAPSRSAKLRAARKLREVAD